MSGVPVLVQMSSSESGYIGHEHLLLIDQSFTDLCHWIEMIVGSNSPNILTNNWAARTCQSVRVRWGSRRFLDFPETTMVDGTNWEVIKLQLLYGDKTDQLEAEVEGMY